MSFFKRRSEQKRESKYLGGWFCDNCGADNPDEQSPCTDLTECNECGAPRAPHAFAPSREDSP